MIVNGSVHILIQCTGVFCFCFSTSHTCDWLVMFWFVCFCPTIVFFTEGQVH